MTRGKCKEVLQALWRYKDCGYSENEIRESLDMAIKALERQPKTGHWIATGTYFKGVYNSIDYAKCSCCGYESLEEGHYCPFCGARMEN